MLPLKGAAVIQRQLIVPRGKGGPVLLNLQIFKRILISYIYIYMKSVHLNTFSNVLKLGVWLQKPLFFSPVIPCNLCFLSFGVCLFFSILFPLPRILGPLSSSTHTLRCHLWDGYLQL